MLVPGDAVGYRGFAGNVMIIKEIRELNSKIPDYSRYAGCQQSTANFKVSNGDPLAVWLPARIAFVGAERFGFR
tara:strand:- start:22754 stop:22975 length:222 start_codon:yes stop_codon:yes gene_type:complete